jgi:hypothetical protein
MKRSHFLADDEHDHEDVFLVNTRTPRPRESELQPLIPRSELIHEYGPESSNLPQQQTPRRSFVSRFIPMRIRRKKGVSRHMLPVDIISADAALHGLATIRRKPLTTHNEEPDPPEDKESHYLKSKLWRALSFFSV